MASLELLSKMTTRLNYLYSYIALLELSVSIKLVASSARVTSVKSHKPLGVTDGQPDPTIGPQVYLGPIKRFVPSEKRVLPLLVFVGLIVYFAIAAIFYFDF